MSGRVRHATAVPARHSRFQQRVVAPLHLLGRYILDPVADAPPVAERVPDGARALAVELVLRLSFDAGARLGRAPDHRVGVVDVQMERHARAADRLRTRIPNSGNSSASISASDRRNTRCMDPVGRTCSRAAATTPCVASGSPVHSSRTNGRSAGRGRESRSHLRPHDYSIAGRRRPAISGTSADGRRKLPFVPAGGAEHPLQRARTCGSPRQRGFRS
jgi:hypothetical protein